MIIITLRELIDSFNSLLVLSTKDLPASLSFTLADTLAEALKKKEQYDKTQRDLIERYAKKDAEGKAIASAVPGQPGAQRFDIEPAHARL